MTLDITMIAMPRPELHRNVFRSLKRYMQNIDHNGITLYLNVDPYPLANRNEKMEMEALRSEVIAIASSYFRTIITLPSVAGKANACKRVWRATTADIVMHYEDDWRLFRPLDMGRVRELFDANDWLQWMYLGSSNHRKNPMRHRWILMPPSIFRGQLIRKIAAQLHDFPNPEVQLKQRKDWDLFPGYGTIPLNEYAIPCPSPGFSRHMVIDIGSKWLEQSKFKRIFPSNVWGRR